MARLRRDHHRVLGNGYCTRPAQLDCAFESICETCAFFQTSIEFRSTLQAQHADDDAKGQHQRAQLFGRLLSNRSVQRPTGPALARSRRSLAEAMDAGADQARGSRSTSVAVRWLVFRCLRHAVVWPQPRSGRTLDDRVRWGSDGVGAVMGT
jgi:hypothetical protein